MIKISFFFSLSLIGQNLWHFLLFIQYFIYLLFKTVITLKSEFLFFLLLLHLQISPQNIVQFHIEDIIYLENLPLTSCKPNGVVIFNASTIPCTYSNHSTSHRVQNFSVGLSPLFFYNLVKDLKCADYHFMPTASLSNQECNRHLVSIY